ncbi:MAG: hypothetical protein EXR75_02510 [Myxococcales bacterium]|nr:hypothetical protein [Myxococcales bacterium]
MCLTSRFALPRITRLPIGRALGLALVFSELIACRFEQPRDDGQTGTGGQGGHAEAMPLSIATWNVHNLINDNLDSGLPFEDVDAGYQAHKKAVIRALDELSVDIVMLQEVEHQKVLDELNDGLAKPFAHATLLDGNDPRGVDIAILSRVPLGAVVTHKDEKFTKNGTNAPLYSYARDCLEVHLNYNGREIVLLGVHFKSKDNDAPDKRLAEAQHTRLLADALLADASNTALLILGDYNDLPSSLPVEAVAGTVPRFENAAALAPSTDRWSFYYNGQYELVDHQFANPVLFDMLDLSSVQIPHTDTTESASDHAPILATYLVR